MTNEAELAWAAGVFDGDGTACGYVPRQRRSRVVQMTVYQATTPVLERFRSAVSGHGGIHGPYRGRLYHWTTKRREAVRLLCTTLSPFIGDEKREQLRAAVRGLPDLEQLVARAPQRDREHEILWAAGFFDAEGSVTLTPNGAVLEIPQAEVDGRPSSCLVRFAGIVDVGRLTRPRLLKSPWSKRPQYRWVAVSSRDVRHVALLLSPHLTDNKRDRLLALLGAPRCSGGSSLAQIPSGRATRPAGTFG